MYTREEAEGKRLKNPFDTITEGIGINRMTHNFSQALVDGAFKGELVQAYVHIHLCMLKISCYVMRNTYTVLSMLHCQPSMCLDSQQGIVNP